MKENDNNTNPQLEYYTIEGAAHAEDLAMPMAKDSASLKQSRENFEKALNSWLK